MPSNASIHKYTVTRQTLWEPKLQVKKERKVARTFVPGSERAGPFRSREQKFHGAKWPGSELARFLLADSLLGANGPGSEKVRYHSLSSAGGKMRMCGSADVRIL